MDLSTPKVMGVLNVTPDSFFSGSRVALGGILGRAEKMVMEGADILDIGGYSSRPGAADISIDEELSRVIEPIQNIRKIFPEIVISVDTFRHKVAREACMAGADIVNDIAAGNLDPKMLEVVGQLKVPYIAMHMRGIPQTMKGLTHYDNLVKEIAYYFAEVLERCKNHGILDVIIDPGFGFAKTATQGFELLNRLEYFQHLDRPILVGLSRKSMIYKTLGISAEEALNGTSVLNTLALLKGASILRVHDIKEAKQTIELIKQLH